MNSNQHLLREIRNPFPNQNKRQIYIKKLSAPEFFSNEYEDRSILGNCQNLNYSRMNMRHSKY